MKNVRRNKKVRLWTLVLALLLLVPLLVSCGKENKYVKIGVYNTTDGLCTYLTGKARGLLTLSHYVYFSDSIGDTLQKLTAEKMGIDVAYITVDDLQYLTEDLPVTVICIDNYQNGEIHGVWVANTKWLEKTPTYSARFIDNLCAIGNYCANNKFGTYADKRAAMEGIRDYDFNDYTNPLEFVAMFAAQNNLSLTDVDFDYLKGEDAWTAYADITLACDTVEVFNALCVAAYEKVKDVPNIQSYEKMFTLGTMAAKLTAAYGNEQVTSQ